MKPQHFDSNPRTPYWYFPIEDGGVIVAAESGRLFLLNASALFIWNRWRAGRTAGEIARSLVRAFRIPHEVAVTDTHLAITRFESLAAVPAGSVGNGIVTRSSDATGNLLSHVYAINGHRFRLMVSGSRLQELPIRFKDYECSGSEGVQTTFEAVETERLAVIKRDGKFVGCEPVQSASVTLMQMIGQHCSGAGDWLACLHAGAVAAGNHCVVLAGESGSGKSTLIAALTHARFKLISDDIIGIESGRLLVSGLPLAIKLREGSWSPLGGHGIALQDVPVHSIHGERAKLFFPAKAMEYGRVPAKTIMFVRFSPHNEGKVTRRLSVIESLERLNTAGFWVNPDKNAIRGFLDWIETVTRLELTFPNLDVAIPCVQRILHNNSESLPV